MSRRQLEYGRKRSSFSGGWSWEDRGGRIELAEVEIHPRLKETLNICLSPTAGQPGMKSTQWETRYRSWSWASWHRRLEGRISCEKAVGIWIWHLEMHKVKGHDQWAPLIPTKIDAISKSLHWMFSCLPHIFWLVLKFYYRKFQDRE